VHPFRTDSAMTIEHFDDLLAMARAQPTHQRLLMVFAKAELPDDATEAQRLDFEQGRGGALVPVFCVDKGTDELAQFAQLKAEAAAMGPTWQVVWVAALSAAPGRTLSNDQVSAALEQMIASLDAGIDTNCLPFDTEGVPLQLS
jgi:hypothetical protein